MNELWARIREQVVTIWGSLSQPQRIAIFGGAGAVFLLLIFFITQYSPSYAPLFTRLRPEDAGEIIAVLRDRGVPYRLEEEGTAIMIPPEHVYETRLELAGEGLPRGGVIGFEVFQESAIGTTDFERQVRYQQALQGELTRTIRAMEEIQDARVHVVLPERSLFVREQRVATASVMLSLRPAARLSSSQVQGIAHLMARSVEGLDPENVTILDNRGNVLSDGLRLSEDRRQEDALLSRLDIQRAYENELQTSLQSMLERVYGMGSVVVRVRADMNFDSEEERSEIFEPVTRAGGIARSQQVLEESFTGAQPEAGVPGVETNIPGMVGAAGAGGQFERREETTNFEINRTETVRVTSPGSVQGMSVAVWVDRELDEVQRTQVEETVVAALGLNLARGDAVSIEGLPFEPTTPVTAPPQPLPIWSQPPALVAAILVLALVVFLAARRRRAAAAEDLAGTAALEDDEYVEEERVQTAAEKERQRLRERVQGLARSQPKEFAQLLRAWLAEDER